MVMVSSVLGVLELLNKIIINGWLTGATAIAMERQHIH